MQDGKRCETENDRWCGRLSINPRWVSDMSSCHSEGYWIGGLCMWELITLNFVKNDQQFAQRGKTPRVTIDVSEDETSRQIKIKKKNVERKREKARRKQ